MCAALIAAGCPRRFARFAPRGALRVSYLRATRLAYMAHLVGNARELTRWALVASIKAPRSH